MDKIILGLTGGVATGKSTVANIFARLGACVIDADEISKKVMDNKEMKRRLRETFGDGIFRKNKLDRKKLREIVFENEEKREELNNLSHEIIIKKLREEIEKNKDEKFILVDVPLLFEVGFEKYVDKTLVVHTLVEIELERLMRRDKIDYNAAINMIKSQMDIREKIKKSDYILENNNAKEELEKRAMLMYKLIKTEAGI